jgi:hypothetical protein
MSTGTAEVAFGRTLVTGARHDRIQGRGIPEERPTGVVFSEIAVTGKSAAIKENNTWLCIES